MATIIDPAQANSLIQEYQQQNAAAGEKAIITAGGDLLDGYFLDRKSLESLLSNPKVIGVSVHLAKHPDHTGSPAHQFTLLYAGAEPVEEHPAAEVASARLVNTGAIFSDPPPCPTFCNNLG